jgi:hypothetical protein
LANPSLTRTCPDDSASIEPLVVVRITLSRSPVASAAMPLMAPIDPPRSIGTIPIPASEATSGSWDTVRDTVGGMGCWPPLST